MISKDLPVVEIAYVKDPRLRQLVIVGARMEAYAEDREPYVVSGTVRECKALAKRLEQPGVASIGNLALLSAASARGCEVAMIARRILRRWDEVVAEEVDRYYAERT